MAKGLLSRFIMIFIVIIFCVLLILPTVDSKTMKIVPKQDSAQLMTKIQSRFPAQKYKIKTENSEIVVEGFDLNDAIMNEVKSYQEVKDAYLLPHWAEKFLLAKKINLGLDLQGGMSLTLQSDFELMEEKSGRKFTEKDKKDATTQALEIISNRINTFGVSEPLVRPKGIDSIEIQLPGVKDPDKVRELIGKTGSVEYRLVDEEFSGLAAEYVRANNVVIPEDYEEQAELSKTIAEAISLPSDKKVYFFYSRNDQTGEIFPEYPIVLLREVALNGDDIASASEGYDEMQRPAVHFNTTSEGATKFANVTAPANHGKRLAIVIDEKVRSAPGMSVQISGGQAIIQGDFTIEEVQILTRIIKEGALPVSLRIVEERTVGPSLGQDSIQSGVQAIIVGLLGVMLFMIIYYKLSGIIANICLILNMLFVLAFLSMLGFTLTLPGIAGLILTVGMAVDANVIIFERIKEETKNGKSPKVAVANGFERAFWTIFDSNLTTLLAAIILSQVGTGPIKGFAVTLIIGILSSMFSALFISKSIYQLWVSPKNIKSLSI